MNETLYLKSTCPHCKAVNWVWWAYLQNSDDTYMETEAIECHLCRHNWLIDPEFWIDEKSIEIANPDDNDENWAATIQEFRKTGITPDGKTLAELIDSLANVTKGKSEI